MLIPIGAEKIKQSMTRNDVDMSRSMYLAGPEVLPEKGVLTVFGIWIFDRFGIIAFCWSGIIGSFREGVITAFSGDMGDWSGRAAVGLWWSFKLGLLWLGLVGCFWLGDLEGFIWIGSAVFFGIGASAFFWIVASGFFWTGASAFFCSETEACFWLGEVCFCKDFAGFCGFDNLELLGAVVFLKFPRY